jgi:hypothetical protein
MHIYPVLCRLPFSPINKTQRTSFLKEKTVITIYGYQSPCSVQGAQSPCHVYQLFDPYVSNYWPHCTENPIYLLPKMKLPGLISNSYIHASVSNLYILGSVRLFGCSKISRPILGIYKTPHRYMNVEIGRQSIIILFRK